MLTSPFEASAARKRARALAWNKAHPVQKREADARYRARHRAEARARTKAWREAHPEWVQHANTTYHATNRERELVRKAAYRFAHPEQWREWAHAHPDAIQVIRHRRRARKKAAPQNDLTTAQWQAIKAHYGFRCVYCQRTMQRLTQDHITPLSQGGSHTVHNVVPACQSCNSKKGTKGPLIGIQPLLLI